MKRADQVDMPPELGAVKQLVAQLAAIAARTQLQYHFEHESERGLDIRSLLQAKVKSLRGCGYKEKDLISTALCRRAFGMLTNRTQ